MSTNDGLPEPVRDVLDRRPDALRAVVVSDDDGVEPLYFRDDVERDVDPDRLERKAGILSEVVGSGSDRTPFGTYRAGVRLYDDVAIVDLSTEEGRVVVSADVDGVGPVVDPLTLLFGDE
ncbi:hypothetical protein [Halorubrum sp. DTA98]|uniref:hypothetical protein n=1 Tax=Halorubrum sp. DTA98 TaxID=3402163 RepID=UPI003AAB6741